MLHEFENTTQSNSGLYLRPVVFILSVIRMAVLYSSRYMILNFVILTKHVTARYSHFALLHCA
jgi:hypothetical protein